MQAVCFVLATHPGPLSEQNLHSSPPALTEPVLQGSQSPMVKHGLTQLWAAGHRYAGTHAVRSGVTISGAAQSLQPEAVQGANFPAAQFTHSEANGLASSPGPHGTHAVCAPLLMLDSLWLTRVSLHSRHRTPSSLAVPGWHGSQKLRSLLGCLPAGQSMHVLWSGLATHCGSVQAKATSVSSGKNRQRGRPHAIQSVDPLDENEPALQC